MYIFKRKLAFIAHPKTASSSTRNALRELGVKKFGTHHEVKEKWCTPVLEAGGKVACTVRNPYDLMVSWYFHYMKRRGDETRESFKEWMPVQLSNPNHYIREGLFFGTKWCNVVMRFETLQQDFDALLSSVGMTPTTLEPFNVSHNRESRPYQEMYDDQLKSLVKYHFGAELAEHGYTF